MIAIIRMKPETLDYVPSDEARLKKEGYDVSFQVPRVRVLKRTTHGEDVFEFKPLLFNYGFMRIPDEYLKNPETLRAMRELSVVISGWFYRKPQELEEERLQREAEGLEDFDAVLILVKTIKEEQLTLLFEEARKMDVYDNDDGLSVGSFIVLRKYPFDGLAAEIKRKKTNGKIQVTLLESGLTMWMDRGSILYTAYDEADSYST